MYAFEMPVSDIRGHDDADSDIIPRRGTETVSRFSRPSPGKHQARQRAAARTGVPA